ncbi:MAG: ATP-binding protein [archaeon]|nr:ATP-binding protein [archaeon]
MAGESVDWESDPAGMMKVYQGQNYYLGQSIADLVDNGIDEGATKVEILIHSGKEDKDLFIAIFDNGTGIHESEFDDVMKLGHSTKTDATKLGVFGVGLKLSSLAQADEVTIVSGKKGDVKSLRRISAPYILKHNRNKLMKYPRQNTDASNSAAYEECYTKMEDEDWTTFILLEEIHSKDQFLAINEHYMTSLTKEIERVQVHLGLIFHRILEQGKVEIFIGNGGARPSNKIHPLHPGLPRENDLDFGTVSSGKQTIAYDTDDVQLNITVEYIIHPHTKTIQHKSSRKINKGYKRANDMQGLYIYRNDRLIQYGDWQGMFGDVSRNDEHAKLGKIFIDIPSDHIKLFGLNPTKTEVKLPVEFLRRLLGDSKKLRKWSNIEKGKLLTFFEAFDSRYRKDGKAYKKKQDQGTAATEATVETTEAVTILDPATRVRKLAKKLKPKRIISHLEENGTTITLNLEGTDEEHKNFIEALKEWRINE